LRPLGAINEWLAARWPFSEVSRLVLDEEIAGGASFSYSFGSAVLTVFAIQAVTGIMQLFFYVPTIRDAYRSVGYLHTEVPFGWLIHGLHYWGAQVIIVLMLVHLARVFIWGAYKTPRELTWVAGVGLLLVLMAFSLTGASLPWDQKGYWAGQVSTSVAGVIPIVGSAQKILLRGGQEMGQLTITRFFGIHVAILPLAFLALFSLHIVAMRRFGSAGPWEENKRKLKGPFWPDQVFKDSIVAAVVFVILLTLVVFLPYQFSGPANPFDTNYVPKPEWNFLFLYQALKYFQGSLEPVGAAGIPGLLIILLLVLPFVDRSTERSPFRRPLVLLCGFAVAAAVTAFSLAGYLSPGYGTTADAVKTGSSSSGPWKLTVQAVRSTDTSASDGDTNSGSGAAPAGSDATGPSVSGEAGEAAYVIGSAQRGAMLFNDQCSGCHGEAGKDGLPNPGSVSGSVPVLNPIDQALLSREPTVFAGNIDRVIQHGSLPEGSPSIAMPAFGDDGTLNQQQIANLIAYIMALNGVDRAMITNPGIRPVTFYLVTLGVFLFMGLILAGAWSRRSAEPASEDQARGNK
jgi:ubiquinol-cytochrome c reductase cytochrome b subunit